MQRGGGGGGARRGPKNPGPDILRLLVNGDGFECENGRERRLRGDKSSLWGWWMLKREELTVVMIDVDERSGGVKIWLWAWVYTTEK